MLTEKIRLREGGMVLYGLTPPKKDLDEEKIREIAQKQRERLQGLKIDGLVLYDIQDEKNRNPEERPFPYLETIDNHIYADEYLDSIAAPKICYRAVGKYSSVEFTEYLTQLEKKPSIAVFVGAPSANDELKLSLRQAYQLKLDMKNETLLGGVAIPERHLSKGDEHQRVVEKISLGCQFFITQGVYDPQASLNFLSDYYYHCREQEIDLVPIIFTFTPCGSLKTLQFMKWLGIHFPKWLENELTHSKDILNQSLDFCENAWDQIREFALEKNIPVGVNVESVAVRKAEVEAATELLQRVSRPA